MNEEIGEGAQIILNRMDTNPEEFQFAVEYEILISSALSKWSIFFDRDNDGIMEVRKKIGFNEAEINAIEAKLQALRREMLNSKILKALSYEEPRQQDLFNQSGQLGITYGPLHNSIMNPHVTSLGQLGQQTQQGPAQLTASLATTRDVLKAGIERAFNPIDYAVSFDIKADNRS